MALTDTIRRLLKDIGEDPAREGLLRTPERVAESLQYLTGGYRSSAAEIADGAMFAADDTGMVLLRNISFFSLCEHHLLPFFGKCYLAYIPDGRIIGLSKLGRLVDMYARRLQVQERLTSQIADTIDEVLQPLGVGVVMEAEHLCMQMRGVEKQDSVAVTASMRGLFKDDSDTRAEFFALLGFPNGRSVH